MHARTLIGAMLRPHHREHTQLSDIRLPPNYLDDLLILIVRQIMLRDEVFGNERAYRSHIEGFTSSCRDHLELLLIPLERLQHREENLLSVVIAQYRFRAALRMRHHAQHVSFGIDDPGNVIE
jgi:hypothetical protein